MGHHSHSIKNIKKESDWMNYVTFTKQSGFSWTVLIFNYFIPSSNKCIRPWKKKKEKEYMGHLLEESNGLPWCPEWKVCHRATWRVEVETNGSWGVLFTTYETLWLLFFSLFCLCFTVLSLCAYPFFLHSGFPESTNPTIQSLNIKQRLIIVTRSPVANS